MKRNIPLSSLAVLVLGTMALAACGKSDKVEAKNESVDSVAQKVAKSGMRPTPGRWESQMKLTKMEIAGMPEEMQGIMKNQLGKVTTSVSCLTKEEANKSEKDFFKPPKSSGCKYNSFSMGDGELQADMTCKDDNGTQNMKMMGTYGAQAYQMKINADGNMGGQKTSMAMEVTSKRVGDCDGSEQQ